MEGRGAGAEGIVARGLRDHRRLAFLLAAAVAVAYVPIWHAQYCFLDDALYVTENPFVRGGLSLAGLWNAFFGSRGVLWMPLTFTSHMLDVQLFGLDPAGAHLENVLLHAANAVLLLLFLVRTTGAPAPSLAVAAIFALHPLRVESVAWIAERKDVLSAFFGLLTLHAWVEYARAPGARRYLLVVAGFLLALLSKPMLVTLPILLLLVDRWPLGRKVTVTRAVAEKLPLFALAAAAAVTAVLIAHGGHALPSLEDRSLATRLAHAVVACAWYAWKTVWPADLVVFYPMVAWAPWQVAGAAVGLAAASALAAWSARRAPWIAVGLAWFLVGLLPVLGLVQVGEQAVADRFTYLPGIGLVIAVVWTLDRAADSNPRRLALGAVAVIAAAALGVGTYRQVGYWRDNESLIRHGLAIIPDNALLLENLGDILLDSGRPAEAAEDFAHAIRLEPIYPKAVFGLGAALAALGRPEEAAARYREALALNPNFVPAHQKLAVYLAAQDDMEGALPHFVAAARLNPGAPEAAHNLRLALRRIGLPDAEADGYVRDVHALSAAAAADRARPGGAAYNASLPARLFGPDAEVVHGCLETSDDAAPVPFELYVAVDAAGGLGDVRALPPTRVARCLADALRGGHAPSPPFAPFHGRVAMNFAG
jgi:protein O-mannosyl-transferase